MSLRFALAQINPTVGDLEGNTRKILDYIEKAKKERADIVLFPELAVCGYPPEDLLLKPHFVRACEDSAGEIAASARGIVAVIGSPAIGDDVYNTAMVCAEGEVGAVYRKICLPNYGVFDEQRYFAAGAEILVLSIGEVKLGLTICEDVWLPDGPHVDCAALGGASAILNISASPFHAHKTLERERMLTQRAVDNGVGMVFCNLVGGQDELVFDGGSCVIDHDGRVLARAGAFEEHLLVVDLDLAGALRGKLRDPRHREGFSAPRGGGRPISVVRVPLPAHAAPRLLTADVTPIPDENDLILKGIETGLRDYVRKNGFSQVVIGLSGGVDSALVAALACRALGPENVLGLFMPSHFSSDESREDARAAAENLGFEMTEVSIEGAMLAYDEMLAPLMAGRERDVTEENIQARIRGNILMAVSNKFGRLVLVTGNKSEMSVGYATLYGDMAGAFAPIKDVPKVRVYELCRRINGKAGRAIIPERVLTKAPTAELRENQKDSDSLPEYEVLDRVLTMYVEQEMSFEEITAQGIPPDVARRVIRLVSASEYKRRQAAPGVKISTLAFGRDRRLPITNLFVRREIPAPKPSGGRKKSST